MSLDVKEVSKHYHNKQALKTVTLTFDPDKIYGLLGRNGAGKSTLLNIINNRSFASSGQISLDNLPVTDQEKQLNQLYLMSEDNLFPGDLKVKNIFKLSEAFYGAFDWELAEKMRAAFELDQNQKFRKLSTGYRSIAKLITALCVPCKYVFLDEPVLGLDANHRENFYDFLLETYEARPRTFVISTHLIEEVANLLEDVVILDQGQVLRAAPLENLLAEGKTISGPKDAVAAFTKNLQVISKEELGDFVTVHVIGELPKEIPTTIKVTSLNLQAYFIQLTKGKKAS